jgi:hypothetical protein
VASPGLAPGLPGCKILVGLFWGGGRGRYVEYVSQCPAGRPAYLHLGLSPPWLIWLKANCRVYDIEESEVMGSHLAGPGGGVGGAGYVQAVGGLRLLRAASVHGHWPGSKQCSLADDMSTVLTSCLSQSNGKVILFMLPH